MSKAKTTPLMDQVRAAKAAVGQAILMTRMGDFYEIFDEDAVIAAPILGITLTARNRKSADETPMCGVPYHSVAGQISKLLAKGHKVALMDQIEDPRFAKGLVKRAITRILTPGMVYDTDTLSANAANYMASPGESELAVVDTSTGEAIVFSELAAKEVAELVQNLGVVELVVGAEQEEFWKKEFHGLISVEQEQEQAAVSETLHEQSVQNPSSVTGNSLLQGVESPSAVRLLSYISRMQPQLASILHPFERRNLRSCMQLSPTTVRSLELFANLKGGVEGSLFWVLDSTKTPGGSRLLRRRIAFPWADSARIIREQNLVSQWVAQPRRLKELRSFLSDVGDLERRLTRALAANGRKPLAQNLLRLAQSVASTKSWVAGVKDFFADQDEQTPAPSTEVGPAGVSSSNSLAASVADLQSWAQRVSQSLVEPDRVSVEGRGPSESLVARGVDPRLDECILADSMGKSWLQDLETREKARTQISSLKLRYNSVFGYYFEVTNTHAAKVPADFQRRQTLANAERFVTQELLDLEAKIVNAESKREQLELEILQSFQLQLKAFGSVVYSLAKAISAWDVRWALAWIALERGYKPPQFWQNGLECENSRHPVLEIKKGFVGNSVRLEQGAVMLLTGPNMAGKSTLMRQLALQNIMAQIGSWIPADSARLPVLDSIYTRIGASDSLWDGQSTFLVEMSEVAEMLSRATSRSLLILDEVGRGTSTLDGRALAQSILEHLCHRLSSLCLFATHYHQLTEIAPLLPNVQTAHMRVVESRGEIRFVHQLVPGPAKKSYGIYVAKLAGLPLEVTERAAELLRDHSRLETADAQGQPRQLPLVDLQ